MKPYFQRGIALGALLALVVGGGCKVGSDYQKPNASAQLNESYTQIEADEVQEQVGADVSSWWSQINDETLARLTSEAVSGNLTLREAMFRIQAARAALGSTSSNLLPQVAQDGGYAHQTRQGHSQSVFSTATSMSWEIDVFGRIQRSIEAATADMEVQRELYRDAYVILIGDVAQAYVDARSYQEQIRVALLNIRIQERTVKFVDDNAFAGAMSQLDKRRARGPLNVTEASLSALEAQYQQALNRISILVGQPAGYVDEMMRVANDDIINMTDAELDGMLSAILNEATVLAKSVEDEMKAQGKDNAEIQRAVEEATDELLFAKMDEILPNLIPVAPSEILVGIPADLLRRRPDVRAAEQRIVAQNARVGVAVADLYPMFSLSGSFGLEANSFSNMFDNDSIAAGVGPAFRWNILNFGKYRFNIEAQRFMQEELIAKYRQTILEAAEDVDNALVSYVEELQRNDDLNKAVVAYFHAVLLANFRRESGADTIQPVLEAQAGLLSSQLQRVQCKAGMVGSVVRLYRALVGYWDSNTSSDPTAPASAAVANRR
ncbi:MAG: TolC family protein, partial [Thermoguttaceae bacterium]|nr:TolC family protein [Thermoguttaceae bacterium]